MEEKYKLQYHNPFRSALSIQGAWKRENHVIGDCYVCAIQGTTDVDEYNERRGQSLLYTEPLTLEESKSFISDNREMLGKIHDCIGLTLEDKCEVVDFDEPLLIRNLSDD